MSTDGVKRFQNGHAVRVVAYNRLQQVSNLAKQRSAQKRVALFTLIFMLFQILSPVGSLIKKSSAKASISGYYQVSFSTITATSVKVTYNNSSVGWGDSSAVYIRVHQPLQNGGNTVHNSSGGDTNSSLYYKTFPRLRSLSGAFTITGLDPSTSYDVWTRSYYGSAEPCPYILFFQFFGPVFTDEPQYIDSFTTKSSNYTLTTAVSPASSGTVTGGATGIAPGTVKTATATPNAGYYFDHWAIGTTNYTQNPIDISMTTNKTVTAYFSAYKNLTVAVSPPAGGSVAGTNIACPGDCAEQYAATTTNALTAVPAAGYIFSKWVMTVGSTNTNYTTNPIDASVSSTRTMTAYFNPVYAVTASKTGTGDGTITGAGTYTSGAAVTLTAKAAAGSEFTGWSGDCAGVANCTLTVNGDKTATANFDSTALGQNLLTVSKAGTGTGNVASSPSGISGADLTQNYNVGTTVTLTATASTGSSFTGWSGDCTGTGTCVVTMDAVKNVTATFDKVADIHYAVTVDKAGSGDGSISSSPSGISGSTLTADFVRGTPITLTATPDSNSIFTGWSGDCTGTGICSLTMDNDMNVTAGFIAKRADHYTLTVTKEGTGDGNVVSSPSGITASTLAADFNTDSQVILTATPVAGSVFTGWSGDCSGTGTCRVTMSDAQNVTAQFNLYIAGDLSQPDTYIEKSGIGLMFNDNLPTGATEVNFTATEKETTNHPESNNLVAKRVVDIVAKNQSNANIASGFSAYVSLDFPDAGDAAETKYTIRYWDGSKWSSEGISDISIDTKNNTISFYTTHFSEYGILQDTSAAANNSAANTVTTAGLPTELPKTGTDALNLFVNFLLAIGAYALLIVFIKRTKYSGLLLA